MKENINIEIKKEGYTYLKERKFTFRVDNFVKTNTTNNELIDSLRKEVGNEVLSFLSSHFSLSNQQQILFTLKNDKVLDQVDYNDIKAIVNLHLVNHHKDINQWFCSINKFLPDHGFYAGCVETYHNRKQKMIHRYGKHLAKLIGVFDFIFNRVLSRLKYTKGIYNYITKNKYKALSLAETLGRFVYCGFEIVDYKEVN
jgi:hypothetical protein